MNISIYTTCATTAEAHTLGQGITSALDGARVVATHEVTNGAGDRETVVEIEFPDEHAAHVEDLLNDDNRVVSYR